MTATAYRRLMAASLLLASAPLTARAALPGFDSAVQSAYVDGWQFGDNGGSGFQPWAGGSGAIGVVNDGYSVGDPGWSIAGSPATPIAVADPGNPSVKRAWGVNPGGADPQVFTTRSFTANSGAGVGSLDIGQSVSLDFDTGWQGWFSQEGFSYLGGSSTRLTLKVYFNGSAAELRYIDSTGEHAIANIDNRIGMHTVLTLGEADTFTLEVTRNLNAMPITTQYTGTLAGTSGAGIDTLSLYQQGMTGWGMTQYNMYVNSLSVSEVPEPASVGGLIVGTGILLTRRRRA